MKKSRAPKFLLLKKETLVLLRGAASTILTINYPCHEKNTGTCEISKEIICELK